jgi:hypothetical protein
MKNNKWPFDDPPNVAVFTSKQIIEGKDWIRYVTHDSDDGAWQFHGTKQTNEEDAKLVALSNITEKDPSIFELVDLPLGWHAWRDKKKSGWQRSPI